VHIEAGVLPRDFVPHAVEIEPDDARDANAIAAAAHVGAAQRRGRRKRHRGRRGRRAPKEELSTTLDVFLRHARLPILYAGRANPFV
jgi:hypothetical protein